MKKHKFFWGSASGINTNSNLISYVTSCSNLNGYFMYDNGSWDICTNNNKDLSELPKKTKAKPKKK